MSFPDDDEVRVTTDIDAIFEPRAAIQEIADAMAEEHQLPKHWLNANVRAFSPRELPHSESALTVASVEELVAMKLAAAREQDLFDLGILARNVGITDPETPVDIAFREYGEESVPLSESREDYVMLAKDALARVQKKPKG